MAVDPSKPLADILRGMADTAEEREGDYGRADLRFGELMQALYPMGLHIETNGGFVRLGILVMIANKLLRYTNLPRGHKDSAHDLAVYGAMLERVTPE
jgi:hypothetical protein